ncbi:MAG: hypothetical protein IAF08_03710 [Rhizobacter sp.]|nr:hypothetical protein [Chlorobiales bacterium]
MKSFFFLTILCFAALLFAPAQVQPFFTADLSVAKQSEKSVVVYKTKSGMKFHKAMCYHLNQSMIPISLDEAVAKGLSACKHCQPDTADAAK